MINPEPLQNRLPKTFGLLILGVYFLLFLFANGSTKSDVGENSIHAHHVPFIRLIIPDTVISEWAEDSSERVGVLDRFPLLLSSLILLVAVMLMGRTCLRAFKFPVNSKLELSVLSFGLGTITLTLFTFLLGIAGGLRWWWAYLIPLAISVCLECNTRDGSLREGRAFRVLRSVFHIQQLHWWLVALPVAIILAGAMLPPWEFDVREYHLQVPKEWFQSGTIEHLPHNTYAAMPLGAELITVVPMAWAQLFSTSDGWWHGAMIGKTFLSFYALFAGMAAWALASRLIARSPKAFESRDLGKEGLVATVLVLTCPWIGYISMTGLNEVALGFFLLCTLLVMRMANDTSNLHQRVVLLIGLLAGAAAAVKYTGLVFVILPVAIWLLFKDRQRVIMTLLAFTLGCVITFGPWLIKNAVHTGNPVYPLIGTIFETPGRTVKQVEQWENAHKVPVSDSYVDAFSEFLWQGSRVSPLLIGAVLITLVLHGKRRELWPYFAFVIYSVAVWWFATHHLQRFLVPLIALLAVLGAVGFSTAFEEYPRWKKGWLMVLVSYAVMYLGAGMETDSRFLVKLETLRRGPVLKESDTTTLRVHRYLNQQLGSEGRVVLVGDAEPFDLEMQVYYNSCFDDSILADWLFGQSAQQQLAVLSDNKIDFVYVSWEELDRYQASYGYDERINRGWINELLENGILFEDRNVEIPMNQGQLFRVSN
ncbi:MAG: hypothetical protein MK324_11665 [Pirellulales bacterium]|nr:hypothetical protein [Pirellulales bacterium]